MAWWKTGTIHKCSKWLILCFPNHLKAETFWKLQTIHSLELGASLTTLPFTFRTCIHKSAVSIFQPPSRHISEMCPRAKRKKLSSNTAASVRCQHLWYQGQNGKCPPWACILKCPVPAALVWGSLSCSRRSPKICLFMLKVSAWMANYLASVVFPPLSGTFKKGPPSSSRLEHGNRSKRQEESVHIRGTWQTPLTPPCSCVSWPSISRLLTLYLQKNTWHCADNKVHQWHQRAFHNLSLSHLRNQWQGNNQPTDQKKYPTSVNKINNNKKNNNL